MEIKKFEKSNFIWNNLFIGDENVIIKILEHVDYTVERYIKMITNTKFQMSMERSFSFSGVGPKQF